MGSNAHGVLAWDLGRVAVALKLSTDEVHEYFTDGRRVSFLLERRIAKEVLKGRLAPSEGAGYDLIAPDEGKWEVRSISSGGIYFCPSYMVGSRRSFELEGFRKKLQEIQGYVISDIELFPEIPYWIIDKTQVLEWFQKGSLGKHTKISRKRILKLLGRL